MNQINQNLRAIKAAAKSLFSHIDGVEGFGLGENSLRIYIRNTKVRDALPSVFQGVPVEFVITGEITAAGASSETQAA
jgi:hypothetical protein